jgi:hypothetical protein
MAIILEGGGEEPVSEVTAEQLAFIQELKTGEKAVFSPGVVGGATIKEATILSSLSAQWTEFKERVLNPNDPGGFDVPRPNCTFTVLPFSITVNLSALTTNLAPPPLPFGTPRFDLNLLFGLTGADGFPVVFPSPSVQVQSLGTWNGVKWVFPNLTYSTLAFADPTYKNINYPNKYMLGSIDFFSAQSVASPAVNLNNINFSVTWLYFDPVAPNQTFNCLNVPNPAPPGELANFEWYASKYIYGTPGKPDCFGEFNNFLFTNQYP